MSPPDRRTELEGWIASSRRLQKQMAVGLGLATLIAFIVMFFDGKIGKIGLAFVVTTAICAYWVTGSHIMDWRHQLDVLAEARRKAASGKGK